MKLIKASLEYKSQITEMIKEWKEDIDRNKTNSSPYAIFKNPVDDFSYYLDNLELKEDKDGYVKDSTFFLYDENEDIMSSNERRKANIKKEGIEVTARAIKDGLTSNKIYCRYCGASIESDSRFCKNCGKEQ